MNPAHSEKKYFKEVFSIFEQFNTFIFLFLFMCVFSLEWRGVCLLKSS